MDTVQSEINSSRPNESALIASIVMGGVLLLVNVFRWTLVGWLTVFIEPLLESATKYAFLLVLIWSVIHFIRELKKVGAKRAGMPLLVNLGVLLMVLFVPFTEITTGLNFRWNYKQRTEVVAAVLDGKLREIDTSSCPPGDFIHLPPPLGGLSDGGNIMVCRRDGRTLILFFDFRGVLNSFSGFVYSTGSTKPKSDDFGGHLVEIERLRPNWYWASSTN